MIVVSNTTPLNYLVLVEAIEILPAIFGRLYSPPAVIRELSHFKSPDVVRRWAASPPPWLTVQVPSLTDPSLKLGSGETETILLAQELGADLVLIDERKGYRVAIARGLKVVSTLAILEEAAARGFLDFETLVGRLENSTSFHVSREVVEDSRKRLARRISSRPASGE